MNILLITPVYPNKKAAVGTTPVVHYFTREWIKMGHQVTVFHIETKYPFFFHWFSRLFEKLLYSKLGYPVPTRIPVAYEEVNEGVKVNHVLMRKPYPSPRFKKKQIEKVFGQIVSFCKSSEVPDVFIGHWDSPQLELLNLLKQEFPSVKNALVLHSLVRNLKDSYPGILEQLFKNIDTVGFRSVMALEHFKEKYFTPSRSFIACSGISDVFFEQYVEKTFEDGVHDFVFVGSLIQRKHPLEVLLAVSSVYGETPYHLTFVGDGNESGIIQDNFERIKSHGHLEMTGRVDRNQVVDHLRKSDVFVMISDHETFGLVYLEAMAMGCITIASKGGGVDGIIINGENGFLCNPGDKENLAEIISMIKDASQKELQRISINAVNTARLYSDRKVAESYLKSVVC